MAAVQNDPVSTADGSPAAAPSSSESADALESPMRENCAQGSTDTHIPADTGVASLVELKKLASEELASVAVDASSNTKELVDAPLNGVESNSQVEGKDEVTVHIKDATVDSDATMASAASDDTTILDANDTSDAPKEEEEDASYTNAEDSRAGIVEEASLESHGIVADVNPSAEEQSDSAAALSVTGGVGHEPAHSGPVVRTDPIVSTAVEAEIPSAEQEVTQTASGELTEAVQPDLGDLLDTTPVRIEEDAEKGDSKTAEEGSVEKPAEDGASPVVKEQAVEPQTKEDDAEIKAGEVEAGVQVEEADEEESMASAGGALTIESAEGPFQVEVVAPTPAFTDDRKFEDAFNAEDSSRAVAPVVEDGAAATGEPTSSTPIITSRDDLTPEDTTTPKAEVTGELDVTVQDETRDAEIFTPDAHAEELEKISPALVEAPAPAVEEKADAEETTTEAHEVTEMQSGLREPSLELTPTPNEQTIPAEESLVDETSIDQVPEAAEEPVVEASVPEPVVQDTSASEAPPVEDVSIVAEEQSITNEALTTQDVLSIEDYKSVDEELMAEGVVAAKEPEAEGRLVIEEPAVVDAQPIESPSKAEDMDIGHMTAEKVVEGEAEEEQPVADEVNATEASATSEAKEDVTTEELIAPVVEAEHKEIEDDEPFVEEIAAEGEGPVEQGTPRGDAAREQVDSSTAAGEHPTSEEPAAGAAAEVVVAQEAIDELATEEPLAREEVVKEEPTGEAEPVSAVPVVNDEIPAAEEVAPAESIAEVPTVEDVVAEGAAAGDKASDEDVVEPQSLLVEPLAEAPATQEIIQTDSAIEEEPKLQDDLAVEDAVIAEDDVTVEDKSTAEEETSSIEGTQSTQAVEESVAEQSTVGAESVRAPVGEVPPVEEQFIEKQSVESVTEDAEEIPAPSEQVVENAVEEKPLVDEQPVIEHEPTEAVPVVEERPDPEEKDELVFGKVTEEGSPPTNSPDEGLAVRESFAAGEPIEADTTSGAIVAPEPPVKTEDIAEAPVVEVVAQQSFDEDTIPSGKPTLDVPAVAGDLSGPERPKSPWTPSFQVTTIGQGAPLPVEEDIPFESLDDAEDTTKGQPAIVIEDRSTEDVDNVPAQPLAEAATVEATSLSWTPSYSVHSQGSPSPTHVSLEPEQSLEDEATGEEVVRAAGDKEQEVAPVAEDKEQAEVAPAVEAKEQEEVVPAAEEKEQEEDAPVVEDKEQEAVAPAAEDKEQEDVVPVAGDKVQEDVVLVAEGKVQEEVTPAAEDEEQEVAPAVEDKKQKEAAVAEGHILREESTSSMTETDLRNSTPAPKQDVDTEEITEVSEPPHETEAEPSVALITTELSETPAGVREQITNEASMSLDSAPPSNTGLLEQSFIKEDASLTPPSEQIRPVSPSWVPSYTVSRQGSFIQDQELSPAASEPPLDPAPGLLEVEVEQEITDGHAVLVTPSFIMGDVQPKESQATEEDPETAWTPSYSVTQQGPDLMKGDGTVITESLAQSTDSREINVEAQSTGSNLVEDTEPSAFSPAGLIGVGVVGGPIAALAASAIIGGSNDTKDDVGVKPEDNLPVNGDASPEPKPSQTKVFPTVEIPTEEQTKPNVIALPPLDENNTLDTTSNNLSSPVSPRKRLESTTSSRLFPGGWFSNTSKIPNERTSLEVAQGVFTGINKHATVGEATPTSPTLDPITPIREQSSSDKRKWCIIM